MLNTAPVRWSRTNIVTDEGGAPGDLKLRWHSTWERAHEYASSYRLRRADFLLIADVDRPAPPTPPASKPRVATTRSQPNADAIGTVHRRVFGTTLTLRP